MSHESFASWVAQQYQLPESALSRISKSEEPRYWRLEVPARNDRPAHHLFFTEGLATQHGLEFTLRVSGSPLTDEHSPMRLAVQLMYYREMLDGGVELAPFERVPLGAMMPFPWAAHQQNQGDCSALVVTDPVLRHPRITTLGLLCLSPPMSAATQTLGNPKVAELLTPLVPDLITDLDSPPDPNRPDLAAALRQIAQSAPQKPVIHGLMFELRLRQQGRALDLLVGPRWVAPILHAVEQIYGKEAGPVHPGSTIICVNESHTGVLIISHQDDEGQPIAPGQGRFVVRQMKYARAVNDEVRRSRWSRPKPSSWRHYPKQSCTKTTT